MDKRDLNLLTNRIRRRSVADREQQIYTPMCTIRADTGSVLSISAFSFACYGHQRTQGIGIQQRTPKRHFMVDEDFTTSQQGTSTMKLAGIHGASGSKVHSQNVPG
ncbi:hypothetical protein K466DRAFT_592583, partial [Polyporus arcularius HHB13444]